MMKLLTVAYSMACLPAFLSAQDITVLGGDTWNSRAAAAYLDGRLNWWMSWPGAARDHATFCVSCHTAVPYAMARPALRGPLGEREPSAPEKKLTDNVTARVTA